MKPHWWSRGRNTDPYAIWVRYQLWLLDRELSRVSSNEEGGE